MNIALITNNKLHHKYWVYELYQRHNVKIILHPSGSNKHLNKIKNKDLLKYGKFYFFLKIFSILFNKFNKYSMLKEIENQEKTFFSEYEEKYNEIPREIIHNIETVNDENVIELIKSRNIDLICFLGGDIGKSDFINSANIASLNYHSGISPYYNGNKTIFHAVSDSRPNFAGGTLMYISEKIDGGDILAHYLPEINKNDNAASLFMKNIIGSVKLYSQFIQHITNNTLPEGVSQNRTFKLLRNIDWNIINDLRLKRIIQDGIRPIYYRNEKILNYFTLKKDDISKIYSSSLDIILKK